MTNSKIAANVDCIYETHLSVSSLERAMHFYGELLGFELAKHIPERHVALYWIGGKRNGMLGLWGEGAGPLGMRLHFAFRTNKSGVLNSVSMLKDAGVEPLDFDGQPTREPVVIGWMPALSLYFKDPDGHSIEMLHVLDEDPDPNFGVRSYSAWLRRKI